MWPVSLVQSAMLRLTVGERCRSSEIRDEAIHAKLTEARIVRSVPSLGEKDPLGTISAKSYEELNAVVRGV